MEVKCPYRCCNRELRDAAVNDPSFFLNDNDGVLALDTSHAYYYQVQCQLGISEVEKFFVVWAQETVHIEEIQADVSFFEANVIIANTLIEKAVLPEIIGHWFTNPREETVAVEVAQCSPGTPDVNDNDNEDSYCYCRGNDGSKMICCENDNCHSGQWFHYRCVNIKRAPHGSWFCKECSTSEV